MTGPVVNLINFIPSTHAKNVDLISLFIKVIQFLLKIQNPLYFGNFELLTFEVNSRKYLGMFELQNPKNYDKLRKSIDLMDGARCPKE